MFFFFFPKRNNWYNEMHLKSFISHEHLLKKEHQSGPCSSLLIQEQIFLMTAYAI